MARAPIWRGPLARHLNIQLRPASVLAQTPPPAAPIHTRIGRIADQRRATATDIGRTGKLPGGRHRWRRLGHRPLHSLALRLEFCQRRLPERPGHPGTEPGDPPLVSARLGFRRPRETGLAWAA